MKPYSDDLRLRIIETIQENELTQPEIAEQFSVSLPFVEKVWHRFRITGSYRAKPPAGGVKRLLKDAEAWLREIVGTQPDMTLADLCQRVSAQTGKHAVTTATMCVELQRLKLPLTKSRFMLRKETASEFK